MNQIRLEITGTNPEEFFAHAVKTLAYMTRQDFQTLPVGAPIEAPADVADEIVKTPIIPPAEDYMPKSDVLAESTDTPKKRPGRPAKKAEGETPASVSNPPAQVASAEPAAANLTMENDIRPRAREVVQAVTAREYEQRKTKRGASDETDTHVMKSVSDFVKANLFDGFGIARISELKPERFAEFMSKSEGFLKGDA